MLWGEESREYFLIWNENEFILFKELTLQIVQLAQVQCWGKPSLLGEGMTNAFDI